MSRKSIVWLYLCTRHYRLYRDVKREANQCEIKHIAVSPAYRGKGIGREMIRYVEEHHAFSSIYAETDQEAVLFYKNIGFHITSLGEKYPGVERFGCLLTCNI